MKLLKFVATVGALSLIPMQLFAGVIDKNFLIGIEGGWYWGEDDDAVSFTDPSIRLGTGPYAIPATTPGVTSLAVVPSHSVSFDSDNSNWAVSGELGYKAECGLMGIVEFKWMAADYDGNDNYTTLNPNYFVITANVGYDFLSDAGFGVFAEFGIGAVGLFDGDGKYQLLGGQVINTGGTGAGSTSFPYNVWQQGTFSDASDWELAFQAKIGLSGVIADNVQLSLVLGLLVATEFDSFDDVTNAATSYAANALAPNAVDFTVAQPLAYTQNSLIINGFQLLSGFVGINIRLFV